MSTRKTIPDLDVPPLDDRGKLTNSWREYFKDLDLRSPSTAVSVTTPADGQVLVYNATTGLYEPKTIGSYVSRTVSSGSAVALATGVANNINYVDLPVATGKEWDVGGSVVFLAGVGTVTTEYHVCTDLVSAAVNSDESAHALHATIVTSQSGIIPVGTKRYQISVDTRVYMNCTQTFSGGTLSGYGRMWARCWV